MIDFAWWDKQRQVSGCKAFPVARGTICYACGRYHPYIDLPEPEVNKGGV